MGGPRWSWTKDLPRPPQVQPGGERACYLPSTDQSGSRLVPVSPLKTPYLSSRLPAVLPETQGRKGF